MYTDVSAIDRSVHQKHIIYYICILRTHVGRFVHFRDWKDGEHSVSMSELIGGL